MLAVERLQYIENSLKQNKVVLVSTLSKEMNVTEETIRKDLEKLEAQNILCRVHGGAYLKEGYGIEAPVTVRTKIYQNEKEKLSQKCMEYIREKDSIILDCSTTALHIAKQLAAGHKKTTVITNSLLIASELAKSENIRLIMLGGRLDRNTDSFCGHVTIEELGKYHADKAFISGAGISLEAGLTDYSQEESDVRTAMIRHSSQCFFVADMTKLGRKGVHVTGKLGQLSGLIVERSMDAMALDLKEELEKEGVAVITCSAR